VRQRRFRTVGTHLYRLYAKLRITSRAGAPYPAGQWDRLVRLATALATGPAAGWVIRVTLCGSAIARRRQMQSRDGCPATAGPVAPTLAASGRGTHDVVTPTTWCCPGDPVRRQPSCPTPQPDDPRHDRADPRPVADPTELGALDHHGRFFGGLITRALPAHGLGAAAPAIGSAPVKEPGADRRAQLRAARYGFTNILREAATLS
jgi:hypothetical protein